MAQPHDRPQTAHLGTFLTAYRWLASLFALLIVVQAYLGSRGFFAAEQGLISGHGHLANGMFLLIVIQAVLAWVLYTRNAVNMAIVVLNGVLVVLTIAQTGLGYATRNGENFVDIVSLHIPNGVLLMGISAGAAALAWRIGMRPASPRTHG